MKILLSWSGEASKAVAEALKNWMPLVINRLDPWVSSEDIFAGSRWAIELGRVLEEVHACVPCVTPDNLRAPWLYFEAGAASKRLDHSLVCPYLLGVQKGALPGPLNQFQVCEANKTDTLRLILRLNTSLDSGRIAETSLRRSFSLLWPDLKKKLQTIKVDTDHPSVSDRELLEDMSKRVATLSRNVDRIAALLYRSRKSQKSSEPPIAAGDKIVRKRQDVKDELEIQDVLVELEEGELEEEFVKNYVQRGGE